MSRSKRPKNPALEFLACCCIGIVGGGFFIEGLDGTVYSFGRQSRGEASYQGERFNYFISMAGWGGCVIAGGIYIYQSMRKK